MMQSVIVPECVGIILDGNRRWANAHGLSSLDGHRRGADTLERIVLHARDCGIRHIAAYAFSTENWNRAAEEVSYLMNLIVEMAHGKLARLNEEGVRVRMIGERERLPDAARSAVERIEAASARNEGCTLWVCLSYGGRAEITEAVRSLAASGHEITEESLRRAMWSAEMPDPDLIIRTSGVQRLSNFLLWQAAYSELFFTETLWPDFSLEEFDRILEEYGNRERRRGK